MATETENTPETPETTSEGSGVPETPESGSETLAEGQGETFSREYVEELRRENGKHRQNAKKSDELMNRLVTEMVTATGRLHDARDLPFSDSLLDENGYPDRAKIVEAVDALVKDRPHLAKIRPVGDVGQGAQDGNPSDLAAFGSFLRG